MGSILRPNSNKIRSLRIRKGWPQEQLARIADVSPRTIQRVEAGGNASFETLRSIAGAFELEVHELMQQAPQTNTPAVEGEGDLSRVQLTRTNSSPFLRIIPYFPFLKMIFGSLALVLLASGAIRLLPIFVAYLDPETQVADSHNAISQDSSGLPPVMAPSNEERKLVNAPAPRLQYTGKACISANSTARPASVPATAACVRDPENRLATEIHLALEKGDERPTNGTILVDGPADLSSLELGARGQLTELPVELASGLDTRLAVPQASPGLAELVSHRVAEDYSSVSRSFVRSGKSTAALFSKVGGSIRRAF